MTLKIPKSTKMVGESPLRIETEAKILDGLIMPFWVIPRLLQRNVTLLEAVGRQGSWGFLCHFQEEEAHNFQRSLGCLFAPAEHVEGIMETSSPEKKHCILNKGSILDLTVQTMVPRLGQRLTWTSSNRATQLSMVMIRDFLLLLLRSLSTMPPHCEVQ